MYHDHHTGPLKLEMRVNENADNDYNGNFLRVVDIVRASAIFHSFIAFDRAVKALIKSSGQKVCPQRTCVCGIPGLFTKSET